MQATGRRSQGEDQGATPVSAMAGGADDELKVNVARREQSGEDMEPIPEHFEDAIRRLRSFLHEQGHEGRIVWVFGQGLLEGHPAIFTFRRKWWSIPFFNLRTTISI